VVVVVLPGCRDRPGIAEAVEDLQSQALVTEATVKALGVAVLPGAAGLNVERRDADVAEPSTKLVGSELRSVVAADVIRPPRIANSSESASTTSLLVIPRSTFSARHSRVNSSITESHFSWLPLNVRSKIKSQHQTSFGDSARRRWHPLALTPKRRLFRFFCGTFSPSRCQSRNTRDSPARHPSRASSPPIAR
jgi:hypothetical protein